jgi:dipeptide/tripeptide permease
LVRSISRSDTAIAILLALAMAVFLHRIVHHLRATGKGAPAPSSPPRELRRIRVWIVVMLLLLPVHGWLLTVTTASGDTLLTILLIVAVIAMVYRLVLYTRRYLALRRAS